jgi:transcriptional regulator with XRE-family HTH domain
MTTPPLHGLQCRRDFRGLTQKQMGEVIDASQSQYAKFESGAVRLDVHRAAKLAHFLDCRIEDLL